MQINKEGLEKVKLFQHCSYYIWIVGGLALVLCFFGNAMVMVTDPVEANYVLTAKEMLASGDYLSPRIFGNYWYDKPIFFYWELLASFSLFGITDFAARFFPALFGVLGILLTYGFTEHIYDKKTGFTAALVLLTSLEYFYISKAVITDMTLFVAFSATLICFYIAYSEGKPIFYYLAYICSAIAVLTKGPVGLVQPGLIIILFLAWRHDLKALFTKIKLFSGLLLFIIIAGIWYGPMYLMHGSDFILNFLGVHNVLRATQSEHPKFDVWYYYICIFCIGFFPWVLTLPAAAKRYHGWTWLKGLLQEMHTTHRLPQWDMRQQFLVTWAVVVFVFYQCVATKYLTYTFPYMIPIAIGVAAYLKHYDTWVRMISLLSVAAYLILTVWVAAPICRDMSAYDAGQAVRNIAREDTCVVTYGGQYPVSLTYYSGYEAKRLVAPGSSVRLKPDGISWNATNMMPFMETDKIPNDKNVIAVVYKDEKDPFEAAIFGHWTYYRCAGKWIIYTRPRSL